MLYQRSGIALSGRVILVSLMARRAYSLAG
jgi:hypothetical protein